MQAGDPVGHLTDVALELAEGPVAVGPEQAVLAARIEPERVQLALQRADIVAAEHRGVQVQGAVAEAVARFHQLAPGIGPHDAVHAEQPVLLEAADGLVGRGPETPAALGVVDREAEREEAFLDVADLGSGVSESEDAHACQCAPPTAERQTSWRALSGNVRAWDGSRAQAAKR